MRSIPAALLAAQKSASSEPLVQAVADNTIGGITRLDFTQLDATAQTAGAHGAAVTANGTLHRVRNAAGTVFYMRLIDPETDPYNWGTLQGSVHTPVAIAAIGTRVAVLWVAADKRTVTIKESTDSGTTFGGNVVIFTAGADITNVAIAYKNTAGDLALVWTHAAIFGIMKRAGGVYGAGVTGALTGASLSGIALLYVFDWNIAVTGVETTTLRPTVWTTTYGDGVDVALNTWGASQVQQQAEADAQVTYTAPFLGFVDTYRLTFVEQDAFTGGNTRTYRSNLVFSLFWTAGDRTWRTPAPVDWSDAFGLAIAAGGGHAYESSHSGLWSAPTDVSALTLTQDVLAAVVTESTSDVSGYIDLDNTSGQYAGPPATLSVANHIALSWGYLTPAALASTMCDLQIAGLEYRRTGGISVLRIELAAGWAQLARDRQRTSIFHAAAALSYVQILTRLFARAGMLLTTNGNSSRSGAIKPAFQIAPTTSGLAAVRQALDVLADRIIMKTFDAAELSEPLDTDTSDYSFGTDHPLYDATVHLIAAPASQAHAFGASAFGEAIDFPAAQAYTGTTHQRRDATSTTGPQAAATATAHLRQATLDQDGGELLAPPSCGLEVLDVVDILDALIAPAPVVRRVRELRWRYDRIAGHYDQRIRLGAV